MIYCNERRDLLQHCRCSTSRLLNPRLVDGENYAEKTLTFVTHTRNVFTQTVTSILASSFLSWINVYVVYALANDATEFGNSMTHLLGKSSSSLGVKLPWGGKTKGDTGRRGEHDRPAKKYDFLDAG